jgi:hypothetical protein
LSACRLAEYGYSIRIAAKTRDVPANPPECELLIHQPIVAVEMPFGIYRGLGKESQITQAVINGDNHHPFFHESPGVVRGAAPVNESAAVNPKHHRQAVASSITRFRLRRVDIQEQAILAANPSRLRARTAELSRVEDKSGKESVALRRPPAQRSHRRSRVRDAEKFVPPSVVEPITSPLSVKAIGRWDEFSADAVATEISVKTQIAAAPNSSLEVNPQ